MRMGISQRLFKAAVFWAVLCGCTYVAIGWGVILSRIFGPQVLESCITTFGNTAWVKMGTYLVITMLLCAIFCALLRILAKLLFPKDTKHELDERANK